MLPVVSKDVSNRVNSTEVPPPKKCGKVVENRSRTMFANGSAVARVDANHWDLGHLALHSFTLGADSRIVNTAQQGKRGSRRLTFPDIAIMFGVRSGNKASIL